MSTLADTLRKEIQESGLSIYRVAKESGISVQLLSNFVAGNSRIYIDNFQKVCTFLGLGLTRVEKSKAKPMSEYPKRGQKAK